MSQVRPTSLPAAADAGACPPPLAWQEVVEAVESGAETFAREHDGIEISGLAFGEGQPLWLLGGFTGDRRQFALLAWLLKERYRCFLSDARWTGRPARVRRMVGQLANAYSHVAADLSSGPIAIYASSFGGLVALAMMHFAESQIRGTVLHAAFAHRRYSLTERTAARASLWTKRSVADIRGWRALQEINHRRWFPPIDPARWEFLAANLGQTPAADLGRRLLAASAVDFRRDLHTIQTPVQLIRTEGDGRRLSLAEDELASALPHVREESLHSTGHYAHVTHPHRVAKILSAFVDEIERTP